MLVPHNIANARCFAFPNTHRQVSLLFKPRFRSSHGFTLIELLVVISIVSVLVAILLPALNKARDTSKLITCLANLRSIGVASSLYLSDNTDHFFDYIESGIYGTFREYAQGGKPVATSSSAYHPDVERYDPRPLNTYVGNNYEVFRCPADKGRLGYGDSIYDEYVNGRAGNSYRFNAYGIPGKWYVPDDNPNKNINSNANRILTPTKFMIMADFTVGDVSWSALPTGVVLGMYWPTGLQAGANFHEPFGASPSASMVLADGHAEHFSDIAGEGGKGSRFRLIPEDHW